MKRLFALALVAVIAFGVATMLTGGVQAGSCNGHGKQHPGQGCNQCVLPDPSCRIIECNKCGCLFDCPSGLVRK